MSVQVEQLTKTYGTQQALKGITFEAKPGRILGFLGPNGAGKSTAMKIISGSLAADGGQVSIHGRPISPTDTTIRQRIGYLPESNPVYPDLYVVEALRFFASLHRVPRPAARIEEIIAMTGLAPERHKKIGQLSKGYRQRVGLAQALLHDPDILILDEPTSGLDPNQLQGIRSLIKELGKYKTVLLSTHIMQEVEAVCDDVVIIHQGMIIEDFSLQEFNQKAPGESLEVFFTRLTGKR